MGMRTDFEGPTVVTALRGLVGGIALLMLLAAGAAQAQTAIRSNFDHDSTGFRLEGAHLISNCGACHDKGIFVGTLRECQDCHKHGGSVTATPKPARHILASERCESCHAVRSFLPLRRMDHNEAIGPCASCHNNQVAPGKPVDHPPAGDQCEACHLTVAFSPVSRFDHTGIVDNCFSCHNNVVATGKPPDHLPTTNICEDCHNVNTWSLVINFNHSQALGTCSGCHNGILASGQDADHIPTTAECDACHNTVSWD